MKIAVQLFGHLRTYEECYPLLKQYLLDKYDCDVFMHTWDTIDHSTQTWHNISMENIDFNANVLEEHLKNVYNLKSIKIEHQNPTDLGVINALNKDISIYGMRCMFHSMVTVNKLREDYQKENNIIYDFVITLRPDVELKEDFSIEYYLQRMNEDDINKSFFTYFFPMVGLWNDIKKIGASDVFFFAKPEIISDIFNNINYVIEKIQPITINFGPEVYFLELVNSLNYNICLMKYVDNTEFIIKRPKIEHPENNIKNNTKNKLIKLKISLKNIYLYILPNISFNILNIEFSLFSIINICLRLGGKNE